MSTEYRLSFTASEINKRLGLLDGVDSNFQEQLNDKVPMIRSINGKTLEADLFLSASDVGALPDSVVIPSIDGLATEEYVNNSMTIFLQTIYPIGAIYLSVSSRSPASLFGGTWEQIEDTFLLAAGQNYLAGSTGGEARVTLTKEQVPNVIGDITMHSGGIATNISNTSGCFSSQITNTNKYRDGGT
jgi:hypothetical protein